MTLKKKKTLSATHSLFSDKHCYTRATTDIKLSSITGNKKKESLGLLSLHKSRL